MVRVGERTVYFLFAVPERYPFNPPTIRVCDASLGAGHPRIEPDGTIRLQVLQHDTWNPCMGLRSVLEELKEIMFGGAAAHPGGGGRASPPPGALC